MRFFLCVVLATSLFTRCESAALGGSDITFEAFVERYGKTYAGGKQEIDRRRSIFEENRASVIAQNKAFTSGLSTWWAVINEFADRTKDELQKMRARFPIPASDYQQTMVKSAANPIESDSSGEKNPPAVSWMQYQTPVKNQGGCGSCWAFATTEVLESHLAISENGSKPIVLAPQTLVSCMKNPNKCGGTGGCEGAIAELGFNYTRDAGMALEADFPYTGQDTACTQYAEAVTCSGYVKLPKNSAEALETALATVGPVAVTVAANWATYGGGIFSGGCADIPGYSCSLDHAVVAVGYASDYWLVRNSWGAGWGEKGYIRLSREYDNTTFTDTHPIEGDACVPYPSRQVRVVETEDA